MGKVLSYWFVLVGISLRGLEGAAALPQIEVISQPLPNTPHAFGDSGGILLSADAGWAAFSSTGNGLVTNDNNGTHSDVFLKNLKTSETRLISRTPAGTSATGDSYVTGLSADGRFVLFESDAEDLVAGDGNGESDVFFYDRDSGQVTEVSRKGDAAADGASGISVLTRNGRFVLFESTAENLDARDQNGGTDLFLWDHQSGAVQLVTLDSTGGASASSPFPPFSLGIFGAAVSEDGRYVAYLSTATNVTTAALPPDDAPQVYLRDMAAGTNILISTGSVFGLEQSPLAMSTNGARLVFAHGTPPGLVNTWLYAYSVEAKTLDPIPVPAGIDTNNTPVEYFVLSANGAVLAYVVNGQLYRYDFGTGQTQQISTGLDGAPGSERSSEPALSDDGSVLLFLSFATNLVSSPVSGEIEQLFSYNAIDGKVRLLTLNLSRTDVIKEDIVYPVLSGDGSTAGFMTFATDLVSNDDKQVNDVFITPVSGAGPATLVSVPDPLSTSSTADGSSSVSALSADGRFVVFSSLAPDIVPNDNNDNVDLFLRDRQTGMTRLVSVSRDGVHPLPSGAAFLGMSIDARFIAFADSDLGQGGQSIYIFDAQTGSNQVASIFPDGSTALSNLGFLDAAGKYLAFQATDASGPGIYVRDLAAQQTTKVSVPDVLTQFLGISPGGQYVVIAVRSAAAFQSVRFIDWKAQTSVAVPAGRQPNLEFAADDSAALLYGTPVILGAPLSVYDPRQNTTNFLSSNVVVAAISADGSTVVSEEGISHTGATLVVRDVRHGSATEIVFPHPDTNFLIRGTPSISADGRYVAFATTSPILGGLNNGISQVYVYDRVLTNFIQASQRVGGGSPNFSASEPTISADGHSVVFQSGASDLVENDRNSVGDVFVATLPIVDSDSDGLDDGWELQHFGNLSQGPSGDPDGDGQSNLAEFLAGTDPNGASSRFAITPIVAVAGGKLELSWNAVYGKTYQLQSRTDLSSGAWTNLGAPITARADSVSEEVEVAGSSSGFYRVLAK